MTSEILSIPEEFLPEVIKVIRTGLSRCKGLSKETKEQLTKWCNEEDRYLKRLHQFKNYKGREKHEI